MKDFTILIEKKFFLKDEIYSKIAYVFDNNAYTYKLPCQGHIFKQFFVFLFPEKKVGERCNEQKEFGRAKKKERSKSKDLLNHHVSFGT